MKIKHFVAILGDPQVGKTSLLKCCLNISEENFRKEYGSRTDPLYAEKELTECTAIFKDFSSGTTHETIRPMELANIDGAVIVFDVSERSSFENVPNWIEKLFNIKGGKIPISIVANKIDKRKWDASCVKTHEVMKLIDSLSEYYENGIEFAEVSAYHGIKTREIGENLLKRICKRYEPETLVQ